MVNVSSPGAQLDCLSKTDDRSILGVAFKVVMGKSAVNSILFTAVLPVLLLVMETGGPH